MTDNAVEKSEVYKVTGDAAEQLWNAAKNGIEELERMARKEMQELAELRKRAIEVQEPMQFAIGPFPAITKFEQENISVNPLVNGVKVETLGYPKMVRTFGTLPRFKEQYREMYPSEGKEAVPLGVKVVDKDKSIDVNIGTDMDKITPGRHLEFFGDENRQVGLDLPAKVHYHTDVNYAEYKEGDKHIGIVKMINGKDKPVFEAEFADFNAFKKFVSMHRDILDMSIITEFIQKRFMELQERLNSETSQLQRSILSHGDFLDILSRGKDNVPEYSI